jgi:hypothetical protein
VKYDRLQELRSNAADGRDQRYAWIYADMQRFGNFGAEVPEITEDGLITQQGSRAAEAGSKRSDRARSVVVVVCELA